MPSDFYQEVYKLVSTIPAGRVATYGQVAALLGRPRGARLVGWALNTCPENVPWQRVINRAGMISIENLRASKQLQAELLQAEGVKVELKEGNFWVDLTRYLWKTS
ncbi:MAG: MGMT family protein [Candidatus Veblenbacteria bacterium]|nr:MGMT family protein [Candidatus Veblenbacteria bacterium]